MSTPSQPHLPQRTPPPPNPSSPPTTAPAANPIELVKHSADTIKHASEYVVKGIEKRRPLMTRTTFKNLRYLDHILKRVDKAFLALFLVLTLGGLLLLGARGVLHFTEALPEYGGAYIEGTVGQPKYINPLYAITNEPDLDLTKLIYSSLVDLGPKGEVINDLAEKIEISEDQKTYTVRLHPNVTWTDGEAFTAQDVVFTVGVIQSLDYNSPLRTSLRGITVEKTDDLTVIFKLREIYAPFVTNLTFGILPSHIWASIPPASAVLADQNTKPIGTGPYLFKELTRNQQTGAITSYTVARNPQYFKRAPYIDTLTFRYYNDMDSAVTALNAGEVNGLSMIDSEHADDVQNKNRVQHILLPRVYAFFLNTDRGVLKEKSIRTALTQGLDRPDLTRQIIGTDGTPIESPILPGFFGYTDDYVHHGYDPTAASAALDAAGWKLVEGKNIREKDGKQLSLSLVTTDWPEFTKVAQIAQEMYAKIGVGVVITSVSVSEAQSKYIRPREYDILLYGELMGADPDPFAFWHSTQKTDPGLNLSNYNSDTADRLLEEARQSADPAIREGKYKEFLKKIADDAPAIFLYSPEYLLVVSKALHGADLRTLVLPSDRMSLFPEWFLRTKRVWKKGSTSPSS